MAEKRISIDYGSISGGTDVSDTTAIESDVAEGKIFHLADGSSAVGTATLEFVKTEMKNPTAMVANTYTNIPFNFGDAPKMLMLFVEAYSGVTSSYCMYVDDNGNKVQYTDGVPYPVNCDIRNVTKDGFEFYQKNNYSANTCNWIIIYTI